MPGFFVFVTIAAIGLALSRLMDSDRVKNHIEERGGQLLEKRWNPFGTGWYGDNNRIYEVRYLDRDGNEHEATCKTHAFSGVYWTDDNIVRSVKPSESTQSLQEENARLLREIERLKRSPADRMRPES